MAALSILKTCIKTDYLFIIALFAAEMALATLNKKVVREGQNRPWRIELSSRRKSQHRWSLDGCPFPQFLKASESTARHPLQDENAQSLFSIFRAAGPLISVQADAKIGPEQQTCTVHYWKESHARAAQGILNEAYKNKGRLLPYDPYTLHCGVRSCFEPPILVSDPIFRLSTRQSRKRN